MQDLSPNRKLRLSLIHSWACLLALMIIAILFQGCGNPAQPDRPRYVFLFIGDGMGIAQIQAAELFQGLIQDNQVGVRRLSLSGFPVMGMADTFSANSPITDSAAAGTAMAAGRKTRNGRINIDQTGRIPFRTVSEAAHDLGMKIGIISSVSLDHATPACFYTRVIHRSLYYDIAAALPESGFEFFGGGGFIRPKGKKDDRPDVIELAREAGYAVIDTFEALRSLTPHTGKVIAFNQTLLHDQSMPYAIDRDEEGASLADFVHKAVEMLEGSSGFFIMVEGGKIDWACHDNDAATAVREIMAFDDAVGAAVAFYEKHPLETLIVVTADHETGGMALNSEGAAGPDAMALLDHQTISLEEFIIRHLKPYGNATPPGDRKLEDLLPLIETHFGLAPLDTQRLRDLRERSSAGDRRARRAMKLRLSRDDMESLRRSLSETPLSKFGEAIVRLLNDRAGITWPSDSHTAVCVPVFALGVGQQVFAGCYDNTEVAHKLARLLHVDLNRESEIP